MEDFHACICEKPFHLREAICEKPSSIVLVPRIHVTVLCVSAHLVLSSVDVTVASVVSVIGSSSLLLVVLN